MSIQNKLRIRYTNIFSASRNSGKKTIEISAQKRQIYRVNIGVAKSLPSFVTWSYSKTMITFTSGPMVTCTRSYLCTAAPD